MNLSQRSSQKELLDRDEIPFADIKQNMQELNAINTLLGGHHITIKGFNSLRKNKTFIHVCEIGCGGGDNMLAIYKWCRKKSVEVKFTGIDIKDECIAFAKQKEELQGITTWITSDYRKAKLNDLPDIIFSSLFCHHFSNEELASQMQWMEKHSSLGFFINDLQRHLLAYHSIKILTRLFSKSYLVKNDAALSVARGFSKKDWDNIFASADIKSYQIQWQWAFRYLIVYKHEQ